MSGLVLVGFDRTTQQPSVVMLDGEGRLFPTTDTNRDILRAGKPTPGCRAVLFGDSMTSQFHVDNTPPTSYNPSTGLLQFTSLSNPVPSGSVGMVFNRSYGALLQHSPIELEFVSATVATAFLGKNINGLPNGVFSGTTFLRLDLKQGGNSWVNWLQNALNWPFDIVYNGAQSGDTTANCLARVDMHCLRYSPDVVLMQIPGINDMSAGNGPVDEETIFQNQKALVDKITDAGAFLILLGMTPVLSGESRATLQNMARVMQLNRRLGDYCRTKGRVLFHNAALDIVLPTDTTGLATTAYIKNVAGDYIHYSIPGGRRVGETVAAKVGKIFPVGHDRRPMSAVDCYLASSVTATSVVVASGIATFTSTSHGFLAGEFVRVSGGTPTEVNGVVSILTATANTFTYATTAVDGSATGTIRASRNRNLFNNPLFLTASGGTVTAGVTGTAPSLLSMKNCSGSAGGLTGVASVAAHSLYGNVARLVCSAASLNDLPGFEFTPTSLLNSDISAGRSYSLEGELKIASANWANTPVSEIMIRLLVNAGGTLFSAFAFNTYDGLAATGSLTSDATLHFRTPKLKVPAGAITQAYMQIYLRAAGSWTSNLTMELGRLAFWDVTED
jgi:lysophospholipase L1-like esterase